MLAAGTAFACREVKQCQLAAEPDARRRPPLYAARDALRLSMAAALWGNAVVLTGRRFGHDQEITLVGVPLFGVATAWWLYRRRGFGLSIIGLRRPRHEHLPKVLTVMAAAASLFAAGFAVAGLVTFGEEMHGLRTIRVVVGTAFGEELIHRGVLLAVWARTGVSLRHMTLANMVTFGAWHLAGATCDGFAPDEVIGPAVLAVPLVWLRLRFRSIFVPMVFHAAPNLIGVFKPLEAACPYPFG